MSKFIKKIILIVIILSFGILWFQQMQMMNRADERLEREIEKYGETFQENQRLQKIVDSGETDEYYINEARNRLGRYLPGEIPVKDIND